ncbi:MAG TPA: hypothetical protein VII34_09400, partial [Pyrinomonadaceae bacterium]
MKKLEANVRSSRKKVEINVRSSRKKLVDKQGCLRESEVKLRSPAKTSPQKVAIMNKPSISILIALVLSVVAGIQAQSSRSIESISRPRLVAGSKTGNPAKSKFQGQSTQQQTPSRPTETGNRSIEKASTPNRQQQEESRSSSREEPNASL